MKVKVSKILGLEGFCFSGYVSIDGRNVYMCFNECAYPHLLLKDHVIKTNSDIDDINEHIKFYTRTIGGKLFIDRVNTFFTVCRGGFRESIDLDTATLEMLRKRIDETLNWIDTWFSYDPEVDIDNVIVWDRFELKNFPIDNLKDYYNGHEMTYDNLCD